jgi:23S rRNA pseudouridine1911/1915/1917 synthase
LGSARHWCSVVEGAGCARVDGYIARAAAGILSRSQLKARGAIIRVNGKPVKPSRSLASGDRVEVDWIDEPSPGIEPEDIPLSVLYEDERAIVVDKAQGMVTHPGNGNRRGTLANALLGRLLGAGGAPPVAAELDALVPGLKTPDFQAPGFRAGIVHRLDKDTSGVMIAAKDAQTQAFLAAQFKDRLVRKEYLAITRGIPSPREGRISDRLGRDRRDRKRFAQVESGGKIAVTDYRVIEAWEPTAADRGYALVALRPKTGRTHQLRVHLALLGTPILGDPIYGARDPRFPSATLMLHAFRLKISLPGEVAPRLFRAPVPERFKIQARALGQSPLRGRYLK